MKCCVLVFVLDCHVEVAVCAMSSCGFTSANDYAPYQPGEDVLAFFTGDEERDYVVLSDRGNNRTRVAIHDYVHVLVRHSGLQLTWWMNEGL